MERSIQNDILLHIGKFYRACKIFRNNVGMGWAGKFIRKNGEFTIISNARPLHAGLFEGSHDLIGYTSVIITQEMVGKPVAIFTSIEVKTETGVKRDKQKRWAENVANAGGVVFFAKSTQDVDVNFKLHLPNLDNEPRT